MFVYILKHSIFSLSPAAEFTMPTSPQVDSPTQATHPQLPPHAMLQTHSDVKLRELDLDFGIEGDAGGGANGPPPDSGYIPFLDPHEGESSSEDSDDEEETFSHNNHHSKLHPPSKDPFQSYAPSGHAAAVGNHSRVDPFVQFESSHNGRGAKVTMAPPKEGKLIDWSFSEHQESGASDPAPSLKQERGGVPPQQQSSSSSKQPGADFGSFDPWQTAPPVRPRGPVTGNLLGFDFPGSDDEEREPSEISLQSEARTVGAETFKGGFDKKSRSTPSLAFSSSGFDPFGPVSSTQADREALFNVFHSSSSTSMPPSSGSATNLPGLSVPKQNAAYAGSVNHRFGGPNYHAGGVAMATQSGPTQQAWPAASNNPVFTTSGPNPTAETGSHSSVQSGSGSTTPQWATGRASPYGSGSPYGGASPYTASPRSSPIPFGAGHNSCMGPGPGTGGWGMQSGTGGGLPRPASTTGLPQQQQQQSQSQFDPFADLGGFMSSSSKGKVPSTSRGHQLPPATTNAPVPPMTSRPTYQYYKAGGNGNGSNPQQPRSHSPNPGSHPPRASVIGNRNERGPRLKTGEGGPRSIIMSTLMS